MKFANCISQYARELSSRDSVTFAVRLFLCLGAILLPFRLEAAHHQPCCGPITAAGKHLAEILDGMDVESLWIAHEHVNWETGAPDRGGAYEGPDKHTHCSAFAAAAAKRR